MKTKYRYNKIIEKLSLVKLALLDKFCKKLKIWPFSDGNLLFLF